MKTILIVCTVVLCAQLNAQTVSDPVMDSTLKEAYSYLSGRGRPSDVKEAMKIFLDCANRGSGQAMVEIGLMHKKGIGVSKSKATAKTWFEKAADQGYAGGWYNIGVLYKDETSARPDFKNAYTSFVKAAQMGDDQSVYAEAYMLYKGLGCTQDYVRAAALFRQGAVLGRSNSMYFYGLCLRNGYGVPRNTDSARYWLKKAANKRYGMAIRELETPRAENDNQQARMLASKIRNKVITETETLDKYNRIEHRISQNEITGEFSGYMIRYDWSGQHAIGSSAVKLKLQYDNGVLKGSWVENDTLTIPMEASLTPQALVFDKTKYSRKDHYSPKKSIPYVFEQARLKWTQVGDTLFLAGNIYMFSPQRNEPEKPLFLSLSRIVSKESTNGSNEPLIGEAKAYPNPVTNTITVDFALKSRSVVKTRMISMNGAVVYSNQSGMLEAGFYTLPINVSKLAVGTYIVELQYGTQTKTLKVVKQ